MLKDTILIGSLIIDGIALLAIYFGEIKIPGVLLIIVLFIGIISSNYKIYIESLPKKNCNISLLRDRPFKIKNSYENGIDLMVSYNIFFDNASNTTGVVENIDVKLKNYGKSTDEFVLSKIGFIFEEYFIAEEEVFASLEFQKCKKATKMPFRVAPKDNIGKVIIIYLNIKGTDEEDYINTIKWLDEIAFEVGKATLF